MIPLMSAEGIYFLAVEDFGFWVQDFLYLDNDRQKLLELAFLNEWTKEGVLREKYGWWVKFEEEMR